MKKKILFLNGHLNVGGVERALVDLLKNFDFEKYDVDLVLFEEFGDYYHEIPSEVNVRLINLNSTYGSLFSCLIHSLKNFDFKTFSLKIIFTLSARLSQKCLSLAKPLFKFTNYDCAIAFRPGFCAEVVASCVKSKKKICWWHHGECQYNDETKNRMIETFNSFDTVVSVSKGCEKMIQNYFGNLNDKTVVIPNIIDVDEINRKANLPLSDSFVESKQMKFVSVGRLSPEKNVINIIYIANELIKMGFNNFLWMIIGDGVEYKKIEQEINKYSLNDKIIMLGSKSNPYNFIECSDIMVHPSLVESYCLTVLEGMALNKPCVVTKSIGPMEFIESNYNGILTSDNPKEIANEIITLLTDKELKDKIASNSRKVIDERYSCEKVMKSVEDIL